MLTPEWPESYSLADIPDEHKAPIEWDEDLQTMHNTLVVCQANLLQMKAYARKLLDLQPNQSQVSDYKSGEWHAGRLAGLEEAKSQGGDELQNIKELANNHLVALDKEAKAKMSFDNATNNFTHAGPEATAYSRAMIAASAASKALRDVIGSFDALQSIPAEGQTK